MKLILSTLALGAAATASAIDLGGDLPQAPPTPQTLVPVAESPAAPTLPTLAVATGLALLPTAPPVLALTPKPTLYSQDDAFDKSAKELEKEIKSLRKQLAKMRKELSKDKKKGRRAKAPKEAAERAHVRGEMARVRGEEARVRGEQVRERSARQRASVDRMFRVHEEQADGSLREAREQKRSAERLLGIARRVQRGDVKTNNVWVIGDGDMDGLESVSVVRGGIGQPQPDHPHGDAPHDHTIHLGHGAPGEHGSTINIRVDEGDVHIHAGGAQIHTSKGGMTRSGGAFAPKGHSRTLFGLVAPDPPHAPHAGGNNEFFVSRSGLGESKTGKWMTFSGEGGSSPQIRAWVSSGDEKDEGENLYFFDQSKGKGKVEEFKFPGGHGVIRIEIDDDDDDDGDERDAVVFSYGMTIDGDHAEIPGMVLDLSDLEDMNIDLSALENMNIDLSALEGMTLDLGDLEGMHVNLEQMHVDLEDMSKNLVLDLKGVDFGDLQIDGFDDVELEDLHEHIQEAIEEALEGIDDDEGVEHVIRERVIHFDSDADPSPKSGPHKRFIIRSKKGGNAMKGEVKELKNPFDSNSTVRRASLPMTWAGQPLPTEGAWRTAAFPAPDDELMGLVREIHAEIRAMRAELQELRSEVSNAPRRRGARGLSTGSSTGSGQSR